MDEYRLRDASSAYLYAHVLQRNRQQRQDDEPRFVTKVVKDGETIMEFPPEVLHERIAKEQSIKKIQTILEQVVSIGLGKKAGSPNFLVAGKTGTAQNTARTAK